MIRVRFRWVLAGAVGLILAAPGRPCGAGTVVDFEDGFPVAGPRLVGFRPGDRDVAALIEPGAGGTGTAARVILDPRHDSVFLQGRLRRMYLASSRSVYEPGRWNVLVFRLRVPEASPIVRSDGAALGVWTYHWEPGDVKVGGLSNRELMTDSMMHGYANLRVEPGCGGRWLRVVLSPGAFRQQRNYFHWYAARGVTGRYDFFGTLRQVQLKYLGPWDGPVSFDIDEIGFERHDPTVVVEPGFAGLEVRASGGPVTVPVTLRNPTNRDRRYRFFISSEIGASREAMYQPMWRHDAVRPGRDVQQAVGGDGGLGAAVLVDAAGREVGFREIAVPAGGTWKGAIVHRVRPEMLGPWVEVVIGGERYLARRDTLTTSAVFWDPQEPPAGDMACVGSPPSNADDGRHPAPPGFPRQVRPPPGWRSGDIPLGQVGGYFVSEIVLD